VGSRASSGILSFWEPRAKREPCRRGVSVGERGSKPPGSPAIASAKRWKSVASPKVSVGDTQVCGRGAPETDSRAVAAEGEADSGKVDPLRGGGGDGLRYVSAETARCWSRSCGRLLYGWYWGTSS
jgi:hypothetical protein